jgi:hypothetical protein
VHAVKVGEPTETSAKLRTTEPLSEIAICAICTYILRTSRSNSTAGPASIVCQAAARYSGTTLQGWAKVLGPPDSVAAGL